MTKTPTTKRDASQDAPQQRDEVTPLVPPAYHDWSKHPRSWLPGAWKSDAWFDGAWMYGPGKTNGGAWA